MPRHMLSSSLGIVEAGKFSEALQKARHGQEVSTVIIMRTLGIESWLQSMKNHKLLSGGRFPRKRPRSSPPYQMEGSTELSMVKKPPSSLRM